MLPFITCDPLRLGPLSLSPWGLLTAIGFFLWDIVTTRHARRLGYFCKSLVLPEHGQALTAALTPSVEELRRARDLVAELRSGPAAGMRLDAIDRKSVV